LSIARERAYKLRRRNECDFNDGKTKMFNSLEYIPDNFAYFATSNSEGCYGGDYRRIQNVYLISHYYAKNPQIY